MEWRCWSFRDRIFFSTTKRAWFNHNFQVFFNFSYSSFLSNFVLRAGDIVLNPGPNKRSHSYFSCCHWNVNSFPTDNYCKIAALKAYNSIYNCDCIWFYYKESLAVRVVNVTSWTECLLGEVTIQNKGYVAVVNGSHRNTFEVLLSNILCSKFQFTIILVDLYARSPASWSEDSATLHGA